MSRPSETVPTAKLIVALLFREPEVQQEALAKLCRRFGACDFLSRPKPFTYTTYYDGEMGGGLQRQTGSFLGLMPVDHLPEIKRFTNELEHHFAREGKRRINIDPGFLSEERLILATGKNYTHRIYLRDGIYADLTLIYQRGAYRALPWTYPDYREAELGHWLAVLRQKLILQRGGRLPRRGVSLIWDDSGGTGK